MCVNNNNNHFSQVQIARAKILYLNFHCMSTSFLFAFRRLLMCPLHLVATYFCMLFCNDLSEYFCLWIIYFIFIRQCMLYSVYECRCTETVHIRIKFTSVYGLFIQNFNMQWCISIFNLFCYCVLSDWNFEKFRYAFIIIFIISNSKFGYRKLKRKLTEINRQIKDNFRQ